MNLRFSKLLYTFSHWGLFHLQYSIPKAFKFSFKVNWISDPQPDLP